MTQHHVVLGRVHGTRDIEVPTAGATASQGNTAAAQAGGGASNTANPPGGSAAGASNTVLGGGAGCSLLSTSDVTNAAGIPLPNMVGNISGGMQGATAHDSCLYTKDASGIGADVNVQINTFASGVSTQLTTLRSQAQDQVDTLNSQIPNSGNVKDASVGDAGWEVDYTAGPDETVWFTKGTKLIDVEVNKGTPGAALTLAKIVAGKE